MESSNELMDMVLSGDSAEDITDKIKEILYVKSAEKIDGIRPYIAKTMMGSIVSEED